MLFNDVNSLVDAAKVWAAENMTSLFKKRSDHGKVVLICSHGGLYRPVKKKVADKGRNSSTIKTNCQFRITGRKLSNGQWKIYLNNLVHNHEHPQSLLGLANARRDSNTQHDDIIRLCEANVRLHQILLTLQDSNLLNKRDIYNLVPSVTSNVAH
jgi:hypothetical protein